MGMMGEGVLASYFTCNIPMFIVCTGRLSRGSSGFFSIVLLTLITSLGIECASAATRPFSAISAQSHPRPVAPLQESAGC